MLTCTPAVSVPAGPGRSAVALTVIGPSRASTVPDPAAGAAPATPVRTRAAPAIAHPARRTAPAGRRPRTFTG
ncbi:MAG TPA: hypothetical protein VMK84_28780 [Streptosporangiaceae bacterium]|nr:hypothetical protein [Streptosporangiaceae bacterium]